jgi:hypothetical protein
VELRDLSPDAIKIVLRGKEYNLEFSFLSIKELSILYGSEENVTNIAAKFFTEVTALKSEDVANFLYAGLLHTDIWPCELIDKRRWPWVINREGSLAFVHSQLLPKEAPLYAILIAATWANSIITPEMMDMLEVLSYDDEGKKKAALARKQNGLDASPMQ